MQKILKKEQDNEFVKVFKEFNIDSLGGGRPYYQQGRYPYQNRGGPKQGGFNPQGRPMPAPKQGFQPQGQPQFGGGPMPQPQGNFNQQPRQNQEHFNN